MKFLEKYLIFVAVLLIMMSCVEEISNSLAEYSHDNSGPLKELTFKALFDEEQDIHAQTKTTLVAGTDVYWLPGDQIALCDVEEPFTCTATEPTPTTEFVGLAPQSDKYYVMYPASLFNNWLFTPKVVFRLPFSQQAVKGGFANNLNVAVASADASDMMLRFKNVLGYVKFMVPETLDDLRHVLIESIGGETMSGYGRADCTAKEPWVTPNSDSKPFVQLVSEGPMEPGAYYVAMFSGEYSSGLRFTFRNTAGQVAVKTISKPLTVEPGSIKNIGVLNGLDFKDVPTDIVPPDDEIWYYTNNESIVELQHPENFDAGILSNTYTNGKGVIKFDGKVTVVGESSFFQCSNLTDIYLPDSVLEIGKFAFSGCVALHRFIIPSNVTKIDRAFFDGMQTIINKSSKITELAKDVFKSESIIEFKGVWASEDNRALIRDGEMIAFARGALTEYVVPSGVISIASDVFNDCNKLTRIVLPDGLRKIGDSTFEQCNQMKSINIPESLEEAGPYAFQFCVMLTDVMLPDKLVSIPRGMFYGCWNLRSVTLGDKVKSIGEYAFFDCQLLESIRIPDTIESVFEYAFANCYQLREIDCKYSTADKRALIMNNVLLAFAPYGVKQFEIPSGVTHIGSMAFAGSNELESITIPEGVQRIGSAAFAECKLSNLTLPSTLKYIAPSMFYGNDRLAEVFCHAVSPPLMLGSWVSPNLFPDGTIVRVPKQSIDAYKADNVWNTYTIMDFDEEIYVSSDYSQDGAVKVVQQASVGNGIDIVFMGDAYSDRQIAAGDYEADINKAIEMLFSEEPYKSFRDHFNVYIVKAVSATEGYGLGSTAFNGYFGNGTQVGGDHNKVQTYAQKAISSSRMNEAVVIVMMNREYYAGTCYMYHPSVTNGYGNGLSISYFPLGTDDDMLAGLICHEAGGHGFSKLADEYSYESMGTISSDAVSTHQSQQTNWGWWKNVDFTSDLSAIRWSHFLNDSRYQYDGLGAYEGGLTYWSGVWRPTENSIMRHNTGGFNAPSRESIYYRIHKLAYGSSWTYDYEEFARYDAVSRAVSSSASGKDNYVEKTYPPTAPPVIIPHAWNE